MPDEPEPAVLLRRRWPRRPGRCIFRRCRAAAIAAPPRRATAFAATASRSCGACGARPRRRCATSRSGSCATSRAGRARARRPHARRFGEDAARTDGARRREKSARNAAAPASRRRCRPRDIDEFRRELARRIDAFIDERIGARSSSRLRGRLTPRRSLATGCRSRTITNFRRSRPPDDLDDLADARRPRRGQDARRRRMGARRSRSASRRSRPKPVGADRARRRDRARRARSDGRGRLRPARGASARRAAGLDPDAPPARMAERRGRADFFRRRSRQPARPAIRAPPGRDELAKWRHADATFDMLQFGLRLGERPRQVITTTPRPTALIKRLIDDRDDRGDARRRRAPMRCNLAPEFLDTVVARYAGTRLGRQETRRRDHRGARRRAVVARADRDTAASTRRRR